jgi:hypothetical protein
MKTKILATAMAIVLSGCASHEVKLNNNAQYMSEIPSWIDSANSSSELIAVGSSIKKYRYVEVLNNKIIPKSESYASKNMIGYKAKDNESIVVQEKGYKRQVTKFREMAKNSAKITLSNKINQRVELLSLRFFDELDIEINRDIKTFISLLSSQIVSLNIHKIHEKDNWLSANNTVDSENKYFALYGVNSFNLKDSFKREFFKRLKREENLYTIVVQENEDYVSLLSELSNEYLDESIKVEG